MAAAVPWWNGALLSKSLSVPDLIAEIPRRILSHLPQFHQGHFPSKSGSRNKRVLNHTVPAELWLNFG
jgi:hypothetical protein